MTTVLRYNKRTNTLTPVNKRDVPKKLTPEQRLENHRAWQRKRNQAKRLEYITTFVARCDFCNKPLSQCECPPLDRHVPQYRDVVRTLNVKTMRVKVEIK